MRYHADFLLSFSAQKERKKIVVSASSNDSQRKRVLFLFLVSFVVCCGLRNAARCIRNEWMNRFCSRQFHAASCNTLLPSHYGCAHLKKKTILQCLHRIKYVNIRQLFIMCRTVWLCFALSTICDNKIMRRKIVCKWIILHTQYFPTFVFQFSWFQCVIPVSVIAIEQYFFFRCGLWFLRLLTSHRHFDRNWIKNRINGKEKKISKPHPSAKLYDTNISHRIYVVFGILVLSSARAFQQ